MVAQMRKVSRLRHNQHCPTADQYIGTVDQVHCMHRLFLAGISGSSLGDRECRGLSGLLLSAQRMLANLTMPVWELQVYQLFECFQIDIRNVRSAECHVFKEVLDDQRGNTKWQNSFSVVQRSTCKAFHQLFSTPICHFSELGKLC